MKKYTYCIVNTQIPANNGQRHIYVQFTEKLTFADIDYFKELLQIQQNEFKYDPCSTFHDIVMEVIEKWNHMNHPLANITNVCDGIIIF